MNHRVFAYLRVPADHLGSAAAWAGEYAAQVGQESGNLRFKITTNGAGEYFVWNEFRDEVPFEIHTASDHVANWRAIYEPFMIERRLETVHPIA